MSEVTQTKVIEATAVGISAEQEGMDWNRFKAALIRAIWTLIFQILAFAAVGANLIAIGVPASWAAIASAASAAVMYFVKKVAWPNATW